MKSKRLASEKRTVGTLMANCGTKMWLGNQEAFSGDYFVVHGEENEQDIQRNGICPVRGGVCDPEGIGRSSRGGSETFAADDVKYIVRRLTPVECARLQGFPDDWGNIEPKEDFTEEEVKFWNDVYVTHQKVINGKEVKPKTKEQLLKWYNGLHTDSAEYKMWGNGVALPCVRIPVGGIAECGAKTMASLFDGSGGFPLASVMEGIEPVWCSEVEPYPIAVTCTHFKE